MARLELEDTQAAPSSNPAQTATVPGGGAPREPGAAVAPGHLLGHFRIDKPLGAGGMGEVYLATDLALDRQVAIKVLPDEVARDPVRRDRLIREARAQARVVHPNVAHIYFIGEEQGRLYFAMELIGGANLADRIAAGPVPVDEAIEIIRAAALGLREAHRHGYTHRDVKPSNLMVDGHGVVKVLDFGLAAGAPAGTGAIAAGPVAQTSLAGTPLYMAPEQARGEPVDFRADIYALGATLFHLVSGRPPFEADTVEALISKHASADRPALPRRSGVARTTIVAVDALCTRMMAPEPAQRYASYDELLRALELASAEHTRPAGFWVRSIATGADFALTAVAAIMLVLLARAAGVVEGSVSAGPQVTALYALYVLLSTVRYGRTLGQSLLEVEVVDVEMGGRPSLRQAGLRVAITFGGPVFLLWSRWLLGLVGYDLLSPVRWALELTVVVPAVALLYAALRSPGKRTLWDRLSRTMVRYRGIRRRR